MKKIILLLIVFFYLSNANSQNLFDPWQTYGEPTDHLTTNSKYLYSFDSYEDSFGVRLYQMKFFDTDNFIFHISQINALQDSLSSKLNKNEIYSWAKQSSRPEYNKSDVGLANVNNTSDLDKPISTATQTALNGKLSSEVDGSITNELQTISKFGDNLSISGGNTIALGIPQAVNLTAGNRITITGTYPNLTISYIEPTATTVTRALNTNYTISSTRQANVFYSITSTATNPLLAGTSSGNAYLEYSTNAGSTWIGISQAGNSNGVGLAVAVALTNGQTSVLSGTIPANALVRIRTVVNGSATVAYASGQETY